MKVRLVIVSIFLLGCMSFAQSKLENLSIGIGFQGVFPSDTSAKDNASQNTVVQTATKAPALTAAARYEFGSHSAVEVAFSLGRNTQKFVNAYNNYSSVQSNNGETIASYVYRFPFSTHLRPYALVGGGVVDFKPNNDFTSFSTPSPQFRVAFAYGAGTDITLTRHYGVRLQYRGLIYKEPDFKMSSEFGTAQRTMVSEPSFSFVYHF